MAWSAPPTFTTGVLATAAQLNTLSNDLTFLLPNYATSLPGSPSDSQTAILVDSITLPTYAWVFRYNAGSSNADKWEFVGGSDAVSEVLAQDSNTSATYAALGSTSGPSVALPRAGVYDVAIGFSGYNGTGGGEVSMSYDIGGTGAVDADRVWIETPTSTIITASGARRKTGLSAVTLTAKYKNGGVGTIQVLNRWMRVKPVRVS